MGDSDEAKVHVGNISYSVTEGDLKDKFEEIGAVAHGMLCPETAKRPVHVAVLPRALKVESERESSQSILMVLIRQTTVAFPIQVTAFFGGRLFRINSTRTGSGIRK